MDFSAWRGTLGIVRPTFRPGGMEELIKMMPDGIGVIPLFADIREGTEKEFRSVLDRYESHVAKLAEVGCDVAVGDIDQTVLHVLGMDKLDVIHHTQLIQQHGTHQAVKITARHQTVLLLRHVILSAWPDKPA